MNLLAEQIKIEALAYWKFTRQHQLGAIECWDNDVMTVSKSRPTIQGQQSKSNGYTVVSFCHSPAP